LEVIEDILADTEVIVAQLHDLLECEIQKIGIEYDYRIFLQYPRKRFTVKGANGRDKPEDASRGPPCRGVAENNILESARASTVPWLSFTPQFPKMTKAEAAQKQYPFPDGYDEHGEYNESDRNRIERAAFMKGWDTFMGFCPVWLDLTPDLVMTWAVEHSWDYKIIRTKDRKFIVNQHDVIEIEPELFRMVDGSALFFNQCEWLDESRGRRLYTRQQLVDIAKDVMVNMKDGTWKTFTDLANHLTKNYPE
jgi:hypothetical protein